MQLYLLRPREDILEKDENPWEPWYDKIFGFVIRAESEEMARYLAAAQAGDEKHTSWLDDKLSGCDVLVAEGEPGLIIKDERRA